MATSFEYIEDLYRWAVEQVIKLHGNSGVSMHVIMKEADDLVKFVQDKEKAE